MIGKGITLFLLFYATLAASQPYTPQSVPNTRLINGSYVSNPDAILSSSTVSQINKILTDLESRTTVQVAVVVLSSIGQMDHVEFAQQLFDLWKIGQAKKDNGLLILMVADQRQIRFQTGLGLEGVLPDVICKRIQMEQMVPLFKDGKYNEGMTAGIRAVGDVLENPAYASELRDDIQKESEGWTTFFWVVLSVGAATLLLWYFILDYAGKFSDSKAKDKTQVPYLGMQITRGSWWLQFGVLPIALLLAFNFIRVPGHIIYFLSSLYGYFGFVLLLKRIRMRPTIETKLASKDYFGATEFLQHYSRFWLIMGILFPLPFLIHYAFYVMRISHFRNHPRVCTSCGQPLQKLDENSEDEYLQKGQVFEEKLGSVDYDVWKCSACGATQVLNYVKRHSKYKQCPSCKTLAFYLASDRTVNAPSYSYPGTGEKISRCKFCKHTQVEKYSIAKLTASSSSSSSGSSSSSSSGSSGSSGGSWGGGSSGGGGASSTW